ncbi:hypothetical protein Tco_0322617 [Tanacetum coccineum]
MGSLAPTRADLLPPRKRFRDLYSSEASIEEDTEIDPIENEVDMELGIGDGYDVRDHVEIDPRDVKDDTEEYEADTSAGDTIEVGIDPMSAPIVEEEIVEPTGEDSSDLFGTRDVIVRIVGIETVQRRLGADQLIAMGQRGSCEQSSSSHVSFTGGVSPEARRVNQDLKLGNGNDNGRGDGNGNGTGNGNNRGDNGDGNENRNVNERGDRPVARECTYHDFIKCQPLGFKGCWKQEKYRSLPSCNSLSP